MLLTFIYTNPIIHAVYFDKTLTFSTRVHYMLIQRSDPRLVFFVFSAKNV